MRFKPDWPLLALAFLMAVLLRIFVQWKGWP